MCSSDLAEPKSDTHEAFLEAQQEQLFEFIRDEAEDDDAREAARDRLTELRDLPEPFYLGKRRLVRLNMEIGRASCRERV